jgi:hypothetical protein
VLQGLGDNAIVASICPKNLAAMGSAASDPDYGYNPAVGALMDRLQQELRGSCLEREFETDADGQLACDVVEARMPESPGGCSCASPGHIDLGSATREVVEDELAASGLCGGNTGVSCDDYCLCEIGELANSDLDICRNSVTDPQTVYGYCYVDPDNGFGNPDLVADCPSNQRRILRFMGNDIIAPRASVFVACTR